MSSPASSRRSPSSSRGPISCTSASVSVAFGGRRSSRSSSTSSARICRRRSCLHLQAHHFAEAAQEDLLLDRREQIVRLFAREQLDVRVARDAEGVPVAHLHAREERAQIDPNELLERNELVRPPERDPPRKAARHLHAREVILVRVRIANLHREREREIRDVRKGVPGIDRERREHRIHLLLEILIEPLQLARATTLPRTTRAALRARSARGAALRG